MNEKEKREFYVAMCRCCLIDEAMKACTACHFNIGLGAQERQVQRSIRPGAAPVGTLQALQRTNSHTVNA